MFNRLAELMPEPMASVAIRYIGGLVARQEVQAVALAGSWARGEGGAHSDVDLIVLAGPPVFHRYVQYLDGVEFQVMEGPRSWVLRAYSERRVGTVQRMMAESITLWDPGDLFGELRATAIREAGRGPTQPDPVVLRRARFWVTETFDDLQDVSPVVWGQGNIATASLVIMHLVEELLNAFWLSRRVWPEKPKRALHAIATLEPATASAIARLLDCEPYESVGLAREAVELVLGPIGGLLREPWAAPPETVPAE